LNDNPDHIDRDTMWKHKMRALWLIYKLGRSVERQREFADYVTTCGDDLEAYATWCLAYDKWGAPSEKSDSWVNRFGKDSGEIKVLREQYPDTLDFYRWMEWIATQQLDEAQRQAEHAGMRIGVMSDMAVGVHPQGAEVWWNPDRYVKGVTVGAPPDYFNQQGQNWSQPPLNPVELERTGYLSYRQHGARHVRACGSAANRPHPWSVQIVVDSCRDECRAGRVCQLPFRGDAGHSGY
jgi:4-alpha-glucanotransferase